MWCLEDCRFLPPLTQRSVSPRVSDNAISRVNISSLPLYKHQHLTQNSNLKSKEEMPFNNVTRVAVA